MAKPLFIHIPKNGGMTLRRNPLIRARIVIAAPEIHKPGHAKAVEAKMKQTGDHQGYEHARWIDINPQVTSIANAFCFIRNPWDRVVSRYFFAKKVIEVEKDSDHYGNRLYADVSSFEAFLEERHVWGNEPYMWHRAVRGWYNQVDYIMDEKGIKHVDCLDFNHYNDQVMRYLNLGFPPEARNVTALNNKRYQDIYTKETIQIVADWYAKDIDYFGFDFDTGATRNLYYD